MARSYTIRLCRGGRRCRCAYHAPDPRTAALVVDSQDDLCFVLTEGREEYKLLRVVVGWEQSIS